MNKFISSFNFVILTLIISGTIFLKPQEGFAQRLSSSNHHSAIICADGTVQSWGLNLDGQLGNGLNTNTNFPVTALIDSVIYLSSGGASANGYTLAVKSNGTVWAWGGNTYGNLGDGTYVSRNTPVQVPNLININSVVVPTVQVRAFSLALDNDGIIWAWGENNSGVLGNGTTNNRITPGQVPGLFNVKKITAGGSGNVIALCEDGSVWTWGENNLGQLGDGTTTTKLTPVQLFGLPPMIDIAAGFQHGLGLSVDSNVWAWGVNSAGEIGDDSLITRLNPIRLFSLSGISKVFAGFRTSFALKNDSSLWAWGVNNYGQLGIGTLDSSLHPVQVLTSDITDIGVGGYQVLALNKDGRLWSWGHNVNGPLGDSTNIDRSIPGLTATLCYIPSPEQFFEHRIRGIIYHDSNADCNEQPSELKFQFVPVYSSPGNMYGFSNSSGYYSIKLRDSINYSITPLLNAYHSSMLTNPCPPSYNVTLNNPDSRDTSGFNFGFTGNPCHLLMVDLSSTPKRSCMLSNTIIRYSNTGIAPAYNVTIHVKFDQDDIPVSASLPYTIDVSDSSIVFEIDTLNPQQTGSIQIRDSIACDTDLFGLTKCTKTWILPVNQCLIDSTTGPTWDQSSVYVTSICVNDTVIFQIKNNGSNMAVPSNYRIFADNILVQTGSYQLMAGDSILIYFASAGATVRLEADQTPGHPGTSLPRSTIEGCGVNLSGLISTNQVNNAPMDDEDVDIEIDCIMITGSYDPNDKSNSPLGIDSIHLVTPGTPIDYTIRFQNTGNDTAFKVVIIDTLSNDFDLSTLELGAASHNYVAELSGQNIAVLKFIFDNILLPDSNIDELNSHGLIKYKIKPKSNVALGTQINNVADIFFDFNFPIKTNTSYFTLGNYSTASVKSLEKYKTLVTVYPNPSSNLITFKSDLNQPFRSITIYSTDGKEIQLQEFNLSQSEITLSLNKLSKGIYFAKCEFKNESHMVKFIIN